LSFQPEYLEIDLLKLVAEGDRNAFTQIYNNYRNKIYSIAYELTESTGVSEEIVQDVFLKIWMNREVLSEVRHFRTYLFVISRNCALNAMRQIIRDRNNEKDWQKNNSHLEAAREEDGGEKDFDLLEQAISALPPQQQKVWLLSRREGMSHRQIAAEMQLSKETVKKYIMYAGQAIIRFVRPYLNT